MIVSTLGATSATADAVAGPVALPWFPAATDASELEVPISDNAEKAETAAVAMGLADTAGTASERYSSFTLGGEGGRM